MFKDYVTISDNTCFMQRTVNLRYSFLLTPSLLCFHEYSMYRPDAITLRQDFDVNFDVQLQSLLDGFSMVTCIFSF